MHNCQKPIGLISFLLLILALALPAKALNLELGADTSLCDGNIILDAGVFDSYLWSDNSTSQALLVTQSGLYWVEVDSAGVIDRDSIEIVFYSKPVSSFEVDTSCGNENIVLRNFSFGSPDTISRYVWQFGNGDTSNLFLPEYTYHSSGDFTISLVVYNQFGCSDSSANPVHIAAIPNVDIGFARDTVNIGDTLSIEPVQGGDMAHWSPPFSISDTLNDTCLVYPTFSTDYTLEITGDNGCVNTATVSIMVNLFPEANDDLVSVDPEILSPIDVLNNDSDPENGITTLNIVEGPYHGSASVAGDSIINYISDPAYAGYDTILYRICDFGKPPLCDFAQLLILVRNSRPNAEDDALQVENGLAKEINVLANDSDPNTAQTIEISFISSPENGSVENLGDGILSYTSNADFSGSDAFFYVLCDNGIPVLCDTAFVHIEVEKSQINVINSFSPNGDGVFDMFTIEGIRNFPNNKLLIFSRWGDVIYEKSPYDNSWDGSRGFSEEVPEGVYFYQLELKDGSAPKKGYLYLKR